jgi:uncharacterized protein (DUF1499 family)
MWPLALLGLLFAAVAVAAALIPRAGWSSNDITTGTHPGYKDLQPRRYDVPPAMAAQFAAQYATKNLGWRVVSTDPATNTVEIAVPVWPGFFTDDLTVTATPEDKGSKVVIRSRSRVGSGDLGVNARHIRALQAGMDSKLPFPDSD